MSEGENAPWLLCALIATARRIQAIQNPSARPVSIQQRVSKLKPKKRQMYKQSSFLCTIRSLRSGGVWKRHCKALFRKHVLPLLYNPAPLLNDGGHAMSMVSGYRDLTLALAGRDVVEATIGDEGRGGLGESSSYVIVRH